MKVWRAFVMMGGQAMTIHGWGVGKERSKLGAWLRVHGYTQEELVKASGVSRNTVSNLCSSDYIPSGRIMQKIIKALREVDPYVRADQFWDL